MTMRQDNPKLARRLEASLKMKREALAYLDAVMTDDPPASDVAKRAHLLADIASIEDLL